MTEFVATGISRCSGAKCSIHKCIEQDAIHIYRTIPNISLPSCSRLLTLHKAPKQRLFETPTKAMIPSKETKHPLHHSMQRKHTFLHARFESGLTIWSERQSNDPFAHYVSHPALFILYVCIAIGQVLAYPRMKPKSQVIIDLTG